MNYVIENKKYNNQNYENLDWTVKAISNDTKRENLKNIWLSKIALS